MKRYAVILSAAALVACGGDSTESNNNLPTDAGQTADAAQTADANATTDAQEPGCETQLPVVGDDPLEKLSDYCFFGGDTVGHVPTDALLPYDVNSTLFADDTLKLRFIALPEGTSITYDAMGRWEWPVGSTIIKTFYYPLDDAAPDGDRRILETRILLNEGEEWAAFSYKWEEDQSDATFHRLGGWIELDRVVEGESVATRYRMPNQNTCVNCHGQNDKTVPLGPRTWQMNKTYEYADGEANQLERLTERGWLAGFDGASADAPKLPQPEDEAADLDLRARSYLEANCAHCHNPEGAGGPSGLDLSWTAQEPVDYGVCKRPVAAGEGSGGLFYDIVPGDADSSIIVYRMASEDPGFKMPELPTVTSHDEGVALIRDWINAMEPAGCPE